MWTKNYASPLLIMVASYEAIRKSTENEPQCSTPINPLLIFHLGLELFLLFEENLRSYLGELTLNIIRYVSKVILLYITMCFPINLIFSPTCMSMTFKWIMFSYFTLVAFFILSFICMALSLGLLLILEKLQEEFTKPSIETELNNTLKISICDPNALSTFYTKNSEKLQDMPVSVQELIYFKDQYENHFLDQEGEENVEGGEDDNEVPECVICFDDFSNKSNAAVCFPQCEHLYHYNCLERWLKKKPLCAFCKREFRTSFAEDLKKKFDMRKIRHPSILKRSRRVKHSLISSEGKKRVRISQENNEIESPNTNLTKSLRKKSLEDNKYLKYLLTP